MATRSTEALEQHFEPTAMAHHDIVHQIRVVFFGQICDGLATCPGIGFAHTQSSEHLAAVNFTEINVRCEFPRDEHFGQMLVHSVACISHGLHVDADGGENGNAAARFGHTLDFAMRSVRYEPVSNIILYSRYLTYNKYYLKVINIPLH